MIRMDKRRLPVVAESCRTGEMITGYVCCCKMCRTPFDTEHFDDSRPMGMMTADNLEFGGERVYTDNMRFLEEL